MISSTNPLEPSWEMSIRFWHSNEDLSFLADSLGFRPDIQRRPGDPLQLPSGRILAKKSAEFYWVKQFSGASSEEFQDAIEIIARAIHKSRAALFHLRSSGGRADLYLTLHHGVSIMIDVVALGALRESGIDLSLDCG